MARPKGYTRLFTEPHEVSEYFTSYAPVIGVVGATEGFGAGAVRAGRQGPMLSIRSGRKYITIPVKDIGEFREMVNGASFKGLEKDLLQAALDFSKGKLVLTHDEDEE